MKHEPVYAVPFLGMLCSLFLYTPIVFVLVFITAFLCNKGMFWHYNNYKERGASKITAMLRAAVMCLTYATMFAVGAGYIFAILMIAPIAMLEYYAVDRLKEES